MVDNKVSYRFIDNMLHCHVIQSEDGLSLGTGTLGSALRSASIAIASECCLARRLSSATLELRCSCVARSGWGGARAAAALLGLGWC